jgi:hypothetical protein
MLSINDEELAPPDFCSIEYFEQRINALIGKTCRYYEEVIMIVIEASPIQERMVDEHKIYHSVLKCLSKDELFEIHLCNMDLFLDEIVPIDET